MTVPRGFTNPDVDPATGSLVDHAGLDVLSEDECLELLRSVTLGRIGFVDQAEISVLPINIGWWDNGVAFSTQRGSKLHTAVMGGSVAIEADGFDERSGTGWSVLGRGTASVVTDPRSIGSLDRLGVRSWVRPEVPKHWVHVRLRTVTGRRTAAAPRSS